MRNVRMRSHNARNDCLQKVVEKAHCVAADAAGWLCSDRSAARFPLPRELCGTAAMTDGQTKWSLRLITATSHKRRNLKYVHIENRKKQNKQHNWLSDSRDESNCHTAVASCVSTANSFG